MEYNKSEVEAIQDVVDQAIQVEPRALDDLELLLVGGGSGDVIFK